MHFIPIISHACARLGGGVQGRAGEGPEEAGVGRGAVVWVGGLWGGVGARGLCLR